VLPVNSGATWSKTSRWHTMNKLYYGDATFTSFQVKFMSNRVVSLYT
jgi:hypothetical protein